MDITISDLHARGRRRSLTIPEEQLLLALQGKRPSNGIFGLMKKIKSDDAAREKKAHTTTTTTDDQAEVAWKKKVEHGRKAVQKYRL